MSRRVLCLIVTAITAMFLVVPKPAQALNAQTWVSGVGSDANPCSRTAPCRTFGGAFAKTEAAGEIGCLVSGGFGGFAITKSISIICDHVVGGVGVGFANAITINAAATDKVHLSGLKIFGLNVGLSGISILQAQSVRVTNSLIHEFLTAGISVAPSAAGAAIDLEVIDSIIADNPGFGISVKPSSNASARVTLTRTELSRNGSDGIALDASTTTGKIQAALTDSVFANNGAIGIRAISAAATAEALIDHCTVFRNATGISATGAGALVRFTNSSITANATGVAQGSSGFAFSFGNNAIVGNAANGAFGATQLK